eukprot:TRINITY_DN10936_c0_g1_i1.p1 TRINITY_DN10936_c0_g1~~TRINITY_DN10936_c0_g1_i1.p1  ORF type:complete len:422 (+),score=71.04 TRINITY_DN10936_c0_g1_i1:55-1320(+)
MVRYAIVSLPPHPHMGQFGVVELSPANWVEYKDAKGRTYYFNSVTKVTQWKRPKILQEQDWTEYKNKDGRVYYYNKYTKQTQWTKPEIPDDEPPVQSPLTPATPASKDPFSTAGSRVSSKPGSPKSNGKDVSGSDNDADGEEAVEETPTEEYYAILSIPRTATSQEIKICFRTLARKFHPDRNPTDPAGIRRFQRAQQAYSVLIDAHKRRVYDAFVAYCQTHKVDPSGFVPEFHAFLDLCEALNVGLEPGTKDIPVTIITSSDPNHSIRDWRQFSGDDDQRYYFNIKTQKSQWEKPTDLLEFDVCSRLMGLRDGIAGGPPLPGPPPPQPPPPSSSLSPFSGAPQGPSTLQQQHFHNSPQQQPSPLQLHPQQQQQQLFSQTMSQNPRFPYSAATQANPFANSGLLRPSGTPNFSAWPYATTM